MNRDAKYIRGYSDETLHKMVEQLSTSDYSEEPPWVGRWATIRIATIKRELHHRRKIVNFDQQNPWLPARHG